MRLLFAALFMVRYHHYYYQSWKETLFCSADPALDAAAATAAAAFLAALLTCLASASTLRLISLAF